MQVSMLAGLFGNLLGSDPAILGKATNLGATGRIVGATSGGDPRSRSRRRIGTGATTLL
jgi:hypothetical protein